MGTYTTNYNLFLPSIGEQGWGELVNGNFTTIDNTMKGLSNRIAAVENEVNGNLSCMNVTTSGTITSTGQVVANGGIAGNLTGNVTGLLFVKGTVGASGDVNYATCAAISHTFYENGNSNNEYTDATAYSVTIGNYSISYGNPVRHTWGVYTRRADLTGTTSPSLSTRTATFTTNAPTGNWTLHFYYKKSTDSSYTYVSKYVTKGNTVTFTLSLTVGATYKMYWNGSGYSPGIFKMSIPAGTTYKVKYTTP